MALSWVLLPIVFVIFSSCQGVEYGWLPQKEFLFSVQGKDLAGLPQLKSQYAGFSYSGELRVQSHSPRILLFKLLKMNYTKIHEELPEGWWNGPDNDSRNKTKSLPLTTSTVVVKLSKSRSPEILMETTLHDWQVNFIKGLVSKVVAYLSDNPVSGPNSKKLYSSRQPDVFSVVEDSVVGRCEVLYEVSPLPTMLGLFTSKMCDNRQMWEITKTYNFSNCQILSEDHAHVPSKDCTPGGANCGQFWSRASLTQMVGCGEMNNFILLSSITSSVINAHLHLQNDSQAVLNSNLNITLTSLMDLKQKFNAPQNKQSFNSLLYTYTKISKDLYSRTCQDTAGSNSGEEKSTNDLEFNENSNFNEGYNSRGELDNVQRRGRDKRGLKKKYGQGLKTKSYGQSNEDEPSNYRPNNNDNSNYNSKKNKKNKSWERSSEEEINGQPSEELQLEDQWNISGKEQASEAPNQPFNMFSLAHRTPEDFSCLNQKLRQLIADIASDLEDINILPEKHMMDKLSLAVDICKSMPLDQLTSVSEEVFETHSGHSNMLKSKERKVFRDVVTMCGTHPALLLIKGWIGRQQIEGEEASQMIASLPTHIYSPSKKLFEDFFELVRTITENNEEQLTTTAVLALSNLVRQACVNQGTRQSHFSSIVRPVCDFNFAQRYTEWLVHKLDSDPNQRRVFVEALGNVGSNEIVRILGDIAMNSKYSSYIRTSAVFAMRYQSLRKSPDLPPLLMTLFHNYTLPVSTRISSVAVLVFSDPGISIWQRLAISTWYEPSPAVANFIASSIRSMAFATDTLYSHISKSAKLVLPLTKPGKIGPYMPYSSLSSWHTKDFDRVVLEQLSWLQLYDFSNLYYRHSSRSCGFSRTNIEASFSTSNLDELWTAFKEVIISTSDNHRSQNPTQRFSRSLAHIQDFLKLQPRNMPQFQAELHLKVNNIMERMLIINKDSLKSWEKGGLKILSEILSEGKTLSYQKADMDCFHMSTTTELGFPVEFRVRTPWVVQAKSDLNITVEGLVMGATLMYSSQLLSSLGVMSPWDNTAHLAGAYATNFFQLPPFRLVAKIDNPIKEVKLTSSYIDQHRLLYFSMQPFTSQYKMSIHQPTLLSPDTTRIQLGETIQMPISWLSQYLKTVYTSEETETFNPMDYIKQMRGVVGFPLLMPNMEARSFETVMNPIHPVIMNLSMSMASKSDGLLEYESLLDSLVNMLTNGLAKPQTKPKQKPYSFTSESSEAANGNNPEQSQNSSSSHVTDKIKNNENSNEQYGVNMNNETQSSEDPEGAVNNVGYRAFSTTYESATGSFNASEVNPFTSTLNGSSQSYLIGQALSKINSGKAAVVEFSLKSTHPEQPTNLAVFTTFAMTYSKRVDRLGLFIKKDSSQIRMTVVHEDPVDIAKDLTQRVNQDLQHNIFVDYVTAGSGNDINAHLQASLGASRTTLSQLRSTPLLVGCSQLDSQNLDSSIDLKCQRLQAQIKEIGFGNITIYYNEHGKFIEKMVQTYMDTAKVMLPRIGEKSGQGHNTVMLMFDYSPRTESINAYITTPVKSMNIRRIPLYNIPMSSVINWVRQDISPKDYCGISSQRLRTFDGAQVDYHMSRDWHLVTHDCSGKYSFAVSSQAGNNNSLNIEVNLRDQYVITVEEGPKVNVNDKQQLLDLSHPLLRIIDDKGMLLAHVVHTPDNSIHIILPQDKLDLVYHGTSLIIKAQPDLQGRLGGLCGMYSNSGVERFLTPQGTTAKSFREFINSYIIKNPKSSQTNEGD